MNDMKFDTSAIDPYINRVISEAIKFDLQDRCEGNGGKSFVWYERQTTLDEAILELKLCIRRCCRGLYEAGIFTEKQQQLKDKQEALQITQEND